MRRYLTDRRDEVWLAGRQFRRHPKCWAVIGLTLVVGLAASTSLFAVVDGVLLKPLPYPEAARLVGLQPQRVMFGVFTTLGACTALAAVLNSIRFAEVQANAGVGLEIKVLASVVVGGTLITGGRGTLGGTLAGVALLGVLGTALTFLGVNAFWEKAAQGAIILLASAADALAGLGTRRAARVA